MPDASSYSCTAWCSRCFDSCFRAVLVFREKSDVVCSFLGYFCVVSWFSNPPYAPPPPQNWEIHAVWCSAVFTGVYFSHVMHVAPFCASKNISWIITLKYQHVPRMILNHNIDMDRVRGLLPYWLQWHVAFDKVSFWAFYSTQKRVHKSGSLGLHFIQNCESPKSTEKSLESGVKIFGYYFSLEWCKDYNWQYFMAWHSFQNLISHLNSIAAIRGVPTLNIRLVDLGLLCAFFNNYLGHMVANVA